MISIRQYLFSVGNSHGLTRTLGEIDVCRDPFGNICYSAGNSAVVFRIRHAGTLCALRCYTRPTHNLDAIYGKQLLRNELFVFNSRTDGEWVDVVLSDWIKGKTLHERIREADAEEFARLAVAFDKLAATMLNDDQAHGDLKPENIIVLPDGSLQLIDFDACFLPEFTSQESPELGTAAFQHPARTAANFDARLDDFPVALITTSLHALALDPSLRERHGIGETLLINPQQLSRDPALAEILTLFEQRGMAVYYRIARLLFSSTYRLCGLPSLFDHIMHPSDDTPQPLELYIDGGLWGYRNSISGKTIIPPLYDCGFEFTEGFAAVQLGRTWHFIDPTGTTAICCLNAESVKPFRNGRARVVQNGSPHEIDTTGQIYILEI